MAKGSYRNPAASAVSKTKQSLGLQGTPGSGVLKPKASKPKSGTTSYRQAYDKAGGAAKLGDYGAWEKKAKARDIAPASFRKSRVLKYSLTRVGVPDAESLTELTQLTQVCCGIVGTEV